MALAGVAHFTVPSFFDRIVPRALGRPRLFTYASGVAELLCAALLATPRTRRVGAWGTVAVLVAVFPANILTLMRLPLQVPLIAWAYSHTGVSAPPAAD
jgi:uncharacterized membrane protein